MRGLLLALGLLGVCSGGPSESCYSHLDVIIIISERDQTNTSSIRRSAILLDRTGVREAATQFTGDLRVMLTGSTGSLWTTSSTAWTTS